MINQDVTAGSLRIAGKPTKHTKAFSTLTLDIFIGHFFCHKYITWYSSVMASDVLKSMLSLSVISHFFCHKYVTWYSSVMPSDVLKSTLSLSVISHFFCHKYVTWYSSMITSDVLKSTLSLSYAKHPGTYDCLISCGKI